MRKAKFDLLKARFSPITLRREPRQALSGLKPLRNLTSNNYKQQIFDNLIIIFGG